MTHRTIVWLFAVSAVACSHQERPQSAHAEQAPVPARLETAQVSESAPPQQGIPGDPPVVEPPTAAPSPPPDQTPLTLTPASGTGAPRQTSAALVGNDGSRDKAETDADRESLREIRELIAEDASLRSAASQVVIVARDGRVWLRGQVNTAAQRAAIERAARRAGNVLSVNNELVVME